MKVAHILGSVSRDGGGITEVVRALTQHLGARPHVEVQAFGLQDERTESDLAAWYPSVVHAFPVIGSRAFGYSPRLQQSVAVMQPDVVHCHGLWTYPSIVSARISRSRRPGMVSPHGMLDPWALKNSAWKKRIARLLFEDSHLRGAACLHALGMQELAAIRSICPKSSVCVIPNGITLAREEPMAAAAAHGHDSTKKHVLLHLGRIHPKKGLTNLISAWAAARKDRLPHAEDWSLTIAGWEGSGPSYEAELRRQAAECGVADSVSFPGPLFGAAKTSALRSAAGFVLASISEGMPMTILEAWSQRLPVMMTPECNISEGFDAGAALRVNSTVASLKDGLARLFAMSESDRRAMGDAGRHLVTEHFTWDLAAERLASVYGWLLGGTRPSCVDLQRPRVAYSFS